jgi:hypothetical protein
MDSCLYVEHKFENRDEWNGVPSGWYIGTLLNEEGYHGNNQISDEIMIDGGQRWYVTGLKAALEEVKELLHI